MTEAPAPDGGEDREDRRRRWILWLVLVLLILLVGVCVAVVGGDDDGVSASQTTVAAATTESPPPVSASSTTEPGTTTTSSTTTTLPTETAASGEWVFTVNVTGVDGSVCQGEIGDVYDSAVTISGPPDDITVVGLDDLSDPNDPAWKGSFVEGRLVFEGTRAEDDGVTTARFEMVLSEDGTKLEGEEYWTWDWTSQGQTGTCVDGTSTVTAVRSNQGS